MWISELLGIKNRDFIQSIIVFGPQFLDPPPGRLLRTLFFFFVPFHIKRLSAIRVNEKTREDLKNVIN